MPHAHLLRGEAGRYRVASELLKRNIEVTLPIVDVGIDLYASDGLRLQVKTSAVGSDGKYTFNFKHWKFRHASQGFNPINKEVTHFIFWGIDTDSFWIIPRSDIQEKIQITIRIPKNGNGNSKYSRYLNSWHLLEKER